MIRSISLTRRLTLTVLLLEVLCALALIGAITIHERHTQLRAFDATLQATAYSLMGAVQDADDEADNVLLDMRGVQLGRDAIFRVQEGNGKVLGSKGDLPQLKGSISDAAPFRNVDVHGRSYRFILLHGLRIVDPGTPGGGVPHAVTIIYGTPVDHVWHEVVEAIRFFAIATAILLGFTAAGMVFLLRAGLAPLRELAYEAERITSISWQFEAPASAKELKELWPLAQALEAALARLQRSFQQQKRFTSDAAHELKTDVAIVKSSLQLLSMRRRTADEYTRGLDLILDDFVRLEMTVQKMLTLARLEQPAESSPQVCSLREVIEEAVHQSMPFAEIKEVSVVVQIADDVHIPVDRRDAVLLCSNILLNALQHSPAGSTVRVELAFKEGTARLTVRDEGEGIQEEDRSHLFEPFYRGDSSRSRKSGGTGLGLSICKAICERAGGSIEIANSPAGGALVTVTLPSAPAGVDHPVSAWIKQA